MTPYNILKKSYVTMVNSLHHFTLTYHHGYSLQDTFMVTSQKISKINF